MILTLKHISKSFTLETTKLSILKDLNLEVNKGDIIAIVGESGSGKSTLLSLLAGFSQPDHGEMEWEGASTSNWHEADWAQFRKQSLGFIFQNYHLIPYLTALENVALPLRFLAHATPLVPAKALLDQMGLGERLNHLPSQLSGGEQQRVAMARALVHSPQLVLADEPTGSLDTKTGEAVLSLLFKLLIDREQTAIIVTHSKEVAALCHRVLILKEGRLWPSGT